MLKSLKLKNGMELIIRDAKKEDAKSLIEYLNKISSESDFLTFGEGELDITVEKEEEIIESFLEAENKLFIIALINGKIVGNLNFNGGHRSRIKHTGEFGVSVLKEFWGLGIGKELIQYMINWAKETGIVKKINLRVREDNKRAMKLYEKLGFKKQGVITRDFYVDGKYYSSISMGLEID